MLREAGRERLIPVRAVGGMVRGGLVWLGRGGGGGGLQLPGRPRMLLLEPMVTWVLFPEMVAFRRIMAVSDPATAAVNCSRVVTAV